MILDHFGPFGASRHAPESAVPVLAPPRILCFLVTGGSGCPQLMIMMIMMMMLMMVLTVFKMTIIHVATLLKFPCATAGP